MIKKFKLFEELDVPTGIDWWDRNRRKINEVIISCNDWQTKYKFDDFQRDVVLAKVDLCRRYGKHNDFSEWQFEILDDIESYILKEI